MSLFGRRERRRSPTAVRFNDRGLTLIELVLVIALIAIIGTLSVQRIDSILGWKQESDLRRFASLWQFLHNESAARGEGYRLVLNIDANSYFVRREIVPEPGESVEVDYLKNLRTQGEQRRRESEELEELQSLEEEFEEEDRRQSGALDVLYYRRRFRDPNAQVNLARPLEFPSLAETTELANGLAFRDVVTGNDVVDSGLAIIRLSADNAQFAAIHLAIDDQIFTIANNPATRTVRTYAGDLDFKWSLEKNDDRLQGLTQQ